MAGLAEKAVGADVIGPYGSVGANESHLDAFLLQLDTEVVERFIRADLLLLIAPG